MAAAMLRDKIEKNEALRGKVEVYSSGIDTDNGYRASIKSIETMEEHGIDMFWHRATNMYHSPIADMDLVLCAEKYHKEQVLRDFVQLREKGNVYTLKEYVKDKNTMNIEDPYGGDINEYRRCALEIEECLDKLLAMNIFK
jgi:protein-tyrosine-phosphatase